MGTDPAPRADWDDATRARILAELTDLLLEVAERVASERMGPTRPVSRPAVGDEHRVGGP